MKQQTRASLKSPWRRQNACQTKKAMESAKRIRDRELERHYAERLTTTPTPDAPEPYTNPAPEASQTEGMK